MITGGTDWSRNFQLFLTGSGGCAPSFSGMCDVFRLEKSE